MLPPKSLKGRLLSKLRSLKWNAKLTLRFVISLSLCAYLASIAIHKPNSIWMKKSEGLDSRDLRSMVLVMGPNKMCTGSIIKENLIITAKHCVVDEKTGDVDATEELTFDDGRTQTGKVIDSGSFDPVLDMNRARDWALIQADTHDYPHFEISYEGMNYEEKYTIYGFHLEVMDFVLTKRSGDFLGYLRFVPPMEAMAVYGISVVPGNSGGPILNSKHQIVGIITETSVIMGHVSFGIPLYLFKVNIEALPYKN